MAAVFFIHVKQAYKRFDHAAPTRVLTARWIRIVLEHCTMEMMFK